MCQLFISYLHNDIVYCHLIACSRDGECLSWSALYHAGRWGISIHTERVSAYIPRTGLRAYREDISAHTESAFTLSV